MQEKDQQQPVSPLIAVETYGKVLITGGYLILDQAHRGYVGSTNNIRMIISLRPSASVLDVKAP